MGRSARWQRRNGDAVTAQILQVVDLKKRWFRIAEPGCHPWVVSLSRQTLLDTAFTLLTDPSDLESAEPEKPAPATRDTLGVGRMSRKRKGKPRWFEVRYQLAYQHVVVVGIEARNEAEAIAKAEKAFDAGTIWDDTAAMPLVYDDYEEAADNTLEFEATPMDEKPKPASCVLEWQRSIRMAQFARRVAGLSFSSMGMIDAHQTLADLVDAAREITGIEPVPDVDEGHTDLSADPTAAGVTRQVRSARCRVVPTRVWPVTVGPSQQAEWELSFCLADRWGGLNAFCNDPESLMQLERDASLAGRLREQMWDDITFVARLAGQFGILFEVEYACKESEASFDCTAAEKRRSYTEAVSEIWTGMQRWMPQFPGSLRWAVPDPAVVIYGRPAAWVFAPDGALIEEQRERLGNLLLCL